MRGGIQRSNAASRTDIVCSMKRLGRFGLLVASPAFLAAGMAPPSGGHGRWAVIDRFPLPEVASILQSSQGYLWLATRDGLARFDGVNFRFYNKGNTPGLTVNRIRAQVETPDGTLWFGTDGAGLCRLESDRIRCFSTAEGLSQKYVRSLALSRGGGLWVGTGGKGFDYFNGVRFQPAGLPFTVVPAIREDAGGHIWAAAGSGGLYSTGRPDGERLITEARGLPRGGVTALLLDRQGRLWVGCGGGLSFWQHGRLHQLPGVPPLRVGALFESADGAIWAGIWQRGLARVDEGRLQWIAGEESFGGEDILSLHEDRDANLWVGTATALHRLRASRVSLISKQDGLADEHVRSVAAARDGGLWVSSESGGVARLIHGRVIRSGLPPLPDNRTGSVYEDKRGTLWVATPSGLLEISTGSVRVHTGPDGQALRRVSAISEDRAGLIVASAVSGLYRYKAGGFISLQAQLGIQPGYVYTMRPARDGALWLGTQRGLGLLRDGAITMRGVDDGLPDAEIHSVLEDRDGTLWLGTRSGLARLKAGRFTSLRSSDGLIDEHIFHVLADDRGGLWLHTNQGVLRTSRSAVEARLDTGTGSFQQMLLEGVDGMPRYALSTQSSACRTTDGRLWFATSAGVAVLDPAALLPNPRTPPVVIEQVVLDGAEIASRDGIYSLPAGFRRLELRYTALSLVAPHRTLFRHRMEGRDQHWSQPVTARSVAFEDLEPGPYRFFLTAANNDGVWNEAGAMLEFRVNPPFWRTRLALAIFAGFLLAASALVYWIRIRSLRRRYSFLLDERTRIARELHDTVEQALAGITLQLDTTAARLGPAPDPVVRGLNVARQMARYAMAEARRSIWDLRPSELKSRGLTDALRSLAGESAGRVGFSVQGAPLRLAPEVESNLLRIAQESVANALKHANAAQIHIRLEFDAASLTLTVSDNGRGFDPAAMQTSLSGHFGLLGMKERANRIRGALTVQSLIDHGTSIEVTVPGRQK